MSDFGYINKFPGLILIKDISLKCMGTSEIFANLLDWSSAYQCIGKTDYDAPCKAAEYADDFIKLDKKVFATKEKMVTVDIQPSSLGWKILLAERSILIGEQGNPIGLYNQLVDISNVDLFKKIYQFDSSRGGNKLTFMSYLLSESYNPLPLTEKQSLCLFFLIRGKTVKQIGKVLNVSPRTIESHLELIKNKLACQYQGELIEKAIDSGFLYYIPKNIPTI